jgi:hypothetical protein
MNGGGIASWLAAAVQRDYNNPIIKGYLRLLLAAG